MCGCAHIYKPSNTRPAPPSRFSHIWPLVSWCLWAIVCSADDHCHRLIPLHVALWWMGPTLASTDTGVLDHWGRRNEESRHRRGDLILYFIFYSLGSVSHDPILWVISRWEKTLNDFKNCGQNTKRDKVQRFNGWLVNIPKRKWLKTHRKYRTNHTSKHFLIWWQPFSFGSAVAEVWLQFVHKNNLEFGVWVKTKQKEHVVKREKRCFGLAWVLQ